MKLAVASGKGGTGKTTVSTNIAAVLSDCGESVVYADCDVEAPNGHLFLKPVIEKETPITRLIPSIDGILCTHCGACAKFCRFNALACMKNGTLVFEELCHSCGGCSLVCPTGAISEIAVESGILREGSAGKIKFVSGTFNVGGASSPHVIKATKNAAGGADWIIYDGPPGTSCAMIESVKGCDFTVLVTEPTPFGLHDLKIALEVLEKLAIPRGVVINKSDNSSSETRKVCKEAGVEILAEIPDDIRLAKAYSRGEMASRYFPELRKTFLKIPTAALNILARTNKNFFYDNARIAGKLAETEDAPK